MRRSIFRVFAGSRSNRDIEPLVHINELRAKSGVCELNGRRLKSQSETSRTFGLATFTQDLPTTANAVVGIVGAIALTLRMVDAHRAEIATAAN